MDGTAKHSRPASDIAICLSGFILTCLLCFLYLTLNGNSLQVTYGDTWIFTDLAKRIAFTHSLRMDAVFDIIYPPLYPALISVAYFFKDPDAIFKAIMALNVFVYSSAFVPLYFLLKDYARLTGRQSFCGAVVLLINLWPLRYVAHIASEPLYYALAAWFAWLLVDGAYLRTKTCLAAFIAVLTALPLTKTLGNIVFPCFIGFSCLLYFFSERPRSSRLITRPLLAFSISVLALYLYKKYQLSALPQSGDITGGYLYNLSCSNLLQPSYWIDRTRLDLSWLIRGTKTAAVPLFLALFIGNRKLLVRDPLVIFTAFVFAGTFVIVPLFTPTDPMFREHPRYYIPFVFSFVVILFKYHRFIGSRELLVAAALLTAGIAAGFPPTFLREPIRWQIGVYYCVWFGCLYYGRKVFVNTLLALMCVSSLLSIWGDRKPPSEETGAITGFYDPYGITKAIIDTRAARPDAEVLVDRSWRGQNLDTWREYERVMTGLPFLPVFADIDDRLAEKKNGEKVSLLVTNKPIKNAKKAVQGKHINLYLLEKTPA